MTSPRLQLRGPQTARLNKNYQMPLGQVLVEQGVISHDILLQAIGVAEHVGAPLAQVLLAEGWASETQLLRANADRFAAIALSMDDTPPDKDCAGLLDPLFCLQNNIWPWLRLGKTLVVATSEPEAFEAVVSQLPEGFGTVLMGIASARDIEAAVALGHGARMAKAAETDLPAGQSCRNMYVFARRRHMVMAACITLALAFMVSLYPKWLLAFLGGWAVLTLVALAGMKGIAMVMRLLERDERQSDVPQVLASYPRVSLLVPLFNETDIATNLVARLSQLTYPKARLETLLILEAEDTKTRAVLAQTDLPAWMRIVTVPPGDLKTKPRALNYARRFACGEIIGVYDAEDSPSPDQIEQVVTHFERASENTVCLQGVLDYYNPKMNWLARCFTIEYAAWFRVILPGLSRAGLPIPLGGTTVFFRRHALDEMDGWDAHNVTEDADLGMRLARAGYKTELVRSITLEEANCRLWPWIKQRSRWLKGYTITYLVNMRRPVKLLKDLGFWGFIGFQVIFLASLSQFALAPLMWSFWPALAGMPHPLVTQLNDVWFTVFASIFVVSELIGLIVGVTAVASPRHRHLIPWVPTLMFYFPLGAVAVYKALLETLFRPFYWDKTSHGHSNGQETVDH